MEKKNTTPILMMLGSMLIFGTIGIFRRYIPLPSAMLACVRGLLGGLCYYMEPITLLVAIGAILVLGAALFSEVMPEKKNK